MEINRALPIRMFLLAGSLLCGLVLGCAEEPTQSGWNLNADPEDNEPARFLRYGDKPEDTTTAPAPRVDTWEPHGADTDDPTPLPDVVSEDTSTWEDTSIEEDAGWTPPETVCIGITLAEPVESCPAPPEPEEEEIEDPVDAGTTESGTDATEEEDAGALSYGLFAEDVAHTPEEELDPCAHKPNACLGAPLPDWTLCDFQPQSCGYEALYSLLEFKGNVTVVALFASW